jgi:hypothetical protein
MPRNSKPARARSAPPPSVEPSAPTLLLEAEAAQYIRMSVPFLKAGRLNGTIGNRTPPPPHLKIGRAVRYDKRDLDSWLAARRVDPSARTAA